MSLEPKKERRKIGTGKKIFEEIIAENFPNMVKDLNLQIQESQCIPNKINSVKTTPRHIIKLLKNQR